MTRATVLAEIGFSPSRERITLLGALVNCFPRSLPVPQRMRALGNAVGALLGNQDLHLPALAHAVRLEHRRDTPREILDAPDPVACIDGLRQRPLALQRERWLCAHASVSPAWSEAETPRLAAEVEQVIRGADLAGFLPLMDSNQPATRSEKLRGANRWRHVVNVLTRNRFAHADGALDFKLEEGAGFVCGFSRSAARVDGGPREIVQVPCEAAQQPC